MDSFAYYQYAYIIFVWSLNWIDQVDLIILTCFHLTKKFVEEKFSWLPSKNKVADEKKF